MSSKRLVEQGQSMSVSGVFKCYSLRLADSRPWDIMASREASPWLDRLAAIMELGPGEPNHHRKLLFVRDDHPDSAPPLQALEGDGRSGKGWQRETIGPLRLLSRPGDPDLICDLGEEEGDDLELAKMWQALYPVYLHALESGGLPLHAALVEKEGKAYAIAAPGGTGKSTCSRRIPPPWRALADDEMLVVCDASGTYHAHPLPTWKEYLYCASSRTWNVQHHAPLEAIFFLVQSDEDQAAPIGRGKAATFIYRSTYQIFYKSGLRMNPDTRCAVRVQSFENACQIASSIPAFLLRASIGGRFWDKMEDVLNRGEAGP